MFDISTSQVVTDLFGVLYVDTTAGDITIQIPDASADNDSSRMVILKSGGGNNVILTTTGGTQDIGSVTSVIIREANKGITIISDAGNNKWLNVQDTTIVSRGTTNGELTFWDTSIGRWSETGLNLIWDSSSSGLTSTGNINGLTLSENSVSLVDKYLGFTDFNTYTGDTETAIGLKANIASPTLTGIPAAPTAAINTNTTQIATTEYVLNQCATTNPLMDGSVAQGTLLTYAKADHVHPSDTSRLAVSDFNTYSGTTDTRITTNET